MTSIKSYKIVSFFIDSFRRRKSGSSVGLYMEALKNENNGQLEEAVILYESAFAEAKKNGLNTSFENKILEKLRLLHTVIAYNQTFALRENKKIKQ